MEDVKNNITFGLVIEALKSGKVASRHGWNGKGMYITLQIPDENSKMQLPYIYMSTVNGELVPWVASHTDMLADDWFLLE